MKKILVLVVALVMCDFLAATGKTDDESNYVAVRKMGDVFKVFYDNPASDWVQVAIYDSNDELVFTESLRSRKGFIRPYNLRNLPEGDYRICVRDELGEYNNEICSDDTPEPSENWGAHIDKLTGEGQYLVRLPHEEDGTAAIYIYNEHDQLVYDQLVSTDGGFARVYKLQQFNGPATIQVVNHETNKKKFLVTD